MVLIILTFDYTFNKPLSTKGKSDNRLIMCWHRVSMSWSEDRASQLLVLAIGAELIVMQAIDHQGELCKNRGNRFGKQVCRGSALPSSLHYTHIMISRKECYIERVEGKKRQEVEVSRDQHRNAWAHLVDSVWAVLSGAGPQAVSASMLARKACRQAAAAF